MAEIKLSEECIRDKLRKAVNNREIAKTIGDRYVEGINEGKIIIYESLLSKIKEGVDEII